VALESCYLIQQMMALCSGACAEVCRVTTLVVNDVVVAMTTFRQCLYEQAVPEETRDSTVDSHFFHLGHLVTAANHY